ncbi:hypothetical protein B0O99DRAFT_650173 [Bisporella sp. PMI_857]|nr:hypothetical protein B0O99DRAFT_650173 [Bisporella sp. PMI_857]
MTSTTHPEFKENTEAVDVAKAFADRIRGKTIIVTGVNRGGIGYTTAEAFATQSPAHLIITGRNESKLKESIDALKSSFPTVDIRPLKIDLSSQKSVRAAAAEVISWSDVPAVDILVNSAGVGWVPARTLSEDGIETHFATNHIGHFLLTNLLVPKLKKAERGARVVNVTSGSPMYARIRWSDINFDKKNKELPETERPNAVLHRAWKFTGDLDEESYLPLEGYNQSKVANVLFGIGANKRLYEKHRILSVAVHPGVIKTELGRNISEEGLANIQEMSQNGMFTYKTLGAGSSTSLVAALDPKLSVGEAKNGKENYGSFLVDCQISDKANPGAESSEEAEKLWKLSEELVKEKFVW